jgi:hypothetical protein
MSNTGSKLGTFVDENGRVCTQCGHYKQWEFFYKRSKPHGLQWYHNNCKDCFRLRANPGNGRRRKELKQEVIKHYGGVCACCGVEELPFLTIDHVDNNGADHRRETNTIGGSSFYYWLQKNNYPEGFQVLCWNCNTGKHINGGICPHIASELKEI